MKTKFKKPLWFTVITTLCLVAVTLFTTTGCDKSDILSKTDNNVSFTPCQQNKLRSCELSDKVDVEFTGKGVQITHYDFEVPCDFTTVDVSHTLVNGVLNITQQGSPNQTDCVCHIDVSYTINGILQNEINVIFINGAQVYCYNNNNNTIIEEEDIFKTDKNFKVNGGCKTTVHKSIFYTNRLGNDFDSALESLIRLREPEIMNHRPKVESYNIEKTMMIIDFEYDDRKFYLIEFIDSIRDYPVIIDVIDSRGNCYAIIFCED